MAVHENRDFSRVRIRMLTEVKSVGMPLFLGWIHDVSIGGILVECEERPPLYQACTVSVLVDAGDGPLRVKAHGEVVRHTDKGVAIEFIGVEKDSFPHLVRLISFNAADPDVILDELQRHLSDAPLDIQEPKAGESQALEAQLLN